MSLADVKDVRKQLGGTVNDIILTIVAGAMGKFLESRGAQLEEMDFRVAVPVNTRKKDQPVDSTGNRTSMMPTPLPVEVRDPVERLHRVVETTQELKASKLARVTEAFERVCEWTSASLFFTFARLGAGLRIFNMVVTNVPGPQYPVYLLGARQLEVYSAVPLFPKQALSIGIFSYDGTICWGFNSDWELLPDLHDLVELVDCEIETLRKAAAAAPSSRMPGAAVRSSSI
jgi:WS/DGAT/MGAT family acyltransferase